MKVLYILNAFPVISQTFVLNEMRQMQKRGLTVEVFSIGRTADDLTHPEVREILRVRFRSEAGPLKAVAAHLYWLFSHPLRYLRTLGIVLRNGAGIRKVFLFDLHDVRLIGRSRPDHLHAHFGDFAADLALVAHLLTGIPFSFTTHSYDLFVAPPRNYRLKSRLAVKHVTVSEFNKKYLAERFGVPGSQVSVIRCGVDFSSIPKKEAVSRSRQLVSISRLHPDKRVDALVRVLATLKNRGVEFECRIAGEGSERGRIQALIEESGLSDRVRLLGALTHREVFSLLSTARVKVLYSRVEGVPVSLMEAMAMRVPVVATDACGIPELIENGRSGILVTPEDDAGLADAIQRLLDDESLCERFAEEAYRKVRASFDLDAECGRLAALWRNGHP